MVHHPDHTSEGDEEVGGGGTAGLLTAEKITLSHSVLKDSRLRSLHVLEVLGCPLHERGTGKPAKLSNKVLMDVMELSGEIETLDGSAGPLTALLSAGEANSDG